MGIGQNFEQLIAKLMATIAHMKRLLRKGGSLSDGELEALSDGISVVETYVTLWKAQYGIESRLSKDGAGPWIVTAADRRAAIGSLRRNSAAALLGHLGGLKGGTARARKLSPERRSAIARRAARARWRG